eukprot:COSAG02_NODE_1199_length_13917_cov_8.278043_2_plen_3826_part_00
MVWCAGGAICVQACLGPAATAVINSGVLGFGGGKHRDMDPALSRPSERRRGRRKRKAWWLTATESELRNDSDRHRARFGVDRVGLNSLVCILPDVATVGVATAVACGVGSRAAGAAAVVAVVCVAGLRTSIVVQGLEMGESNGLVAAFAPDLPVEATSVRVGRVELRLSWRLQFGLHVKDVSVELRPYDLGSKALHYARLRRRIERRAVDAHKARRRLDDLEEEQRFIAQRGNTWWLGQSPQSGIYKVVTSWWHPRGARVRRVASGESVVLGYLGVFDHSVGQMLRLGGVAVAVAAIAGSCMCSLRGGDAKGCREAARQSAKAVSATGLIAAFFADRIVAAVLDRVYIEVDRVDFSFTDGEHIACVTCDEVRWGRLVDPTTLTGRTFWQRWIWSTYGPLPSLHSLRTSSVAFSVAAQNIPADACLTVAPSIAEVSVVAAHASAQASIEIGFPAINVTSSGRHTMAARRLRQLRSELLRGSKVMQFGLERLWSPQETALRRWQYAICSVLIDCQRRAEKGTISTELKTRALKYPQRRAARLWSYAFRCVRMELLRAQYGRSKLLQTTVSEPVARGPDVSRDSERIGELEDLDLDDLHEQALAAGAEPSRLRLAEDSPSPRDALISLLLGAEQAYPILRSDRRWCIQIGTAEARFVDTGDEAEATTVTLSAKSLRSVQTRREPFGSALPLMAVDATVGKLSCSFNSFRVLQTNAHVLTARSANCLEITMNSSHDLRARMGALKVSLTPDTLHTALSIYSEFDMADDEYVLTLVRENAFRTNNVSYLSEPVVDEDHIGTFRETRWLRHRHRPQVDIKIDLPIINIGSDDTKRILELDLGTVNAGNTSATLRDLLTSAAQLDDTRYNTVGCRWEGAKATFASKTSGGRQQVFEGFGGTASVQICALSADYMWAQKCPQLQLSIKLEPLAAKATRSTAAGLMDLTLAVHRALLDGESLMVARGDVVEVTPPSLGRFAHTAHLVRSPESARWCLRHVAIEPREWTFSILDECSARPMLTFAFDVDDLRLQHFNTQHHNLHLQLKLHAYAYNTSVVAWEPIIEPWTARLTSLQSNDETHVRFNGDKLNINFCPSLFRSLTLRQSKQSSSSGDVQTWLVNYTGTAIRYRNVCSFDSHGRALARDVQNHQQHCQLEDGAKGFLDMVGPSGPGVSFDQGLAVEFPDLLWHDAEFTDVSREGVQSKLIGGSMAGITVVCVTEVQDDGTRVITLCSGVKVDNQTNRDIEFGLRRCDVAGTVDQHVRSAMVVPSESTGFFPAALWAANRHDNCSSQLVVFRTCDGGDIWTDPYDVRQPIAATSAELVVCNEGTERQFTACLSTTPGYAPAGKLSVLTLFNCLDVQNDFAFPLELHFFEEEVPSTQPTVPCAAGNPTVRPQRRALVEPGSRVDVPEWDPKKDAWMAVANCEGAISSRVCVYRAHDSDDQSLASDVVLRGGRFAYGGIRAEDSSKLNTDSGMEHASCMPLSLHYEAQGITAATAADASHLVRLSCSYLVVNNTPLPLVLRSRHAKHSDRDVVVALPGCDLTADDRPTPIPFTSHGNVEIGKRVDVLGTEEVDSDHPDAMILSLVCGKTLRAGLLDRLTMDVPDPYVKVTFAPRHATDNSTTDKPQYVFGDPVHIGRTTAIQNSADPVWNERFLVRVPPDGGMIALKVMDFDRWSGDDSIGEVKLDVEHGATIEQTTVDVLGLGGMRKGQLEIGLQKATGCSVPPVGLVVSTWGSRVVSTAQAGPQMLPVSLGLDDLGVTVVPLNRSSGAPHVVSIVPRYRVDNMSRHNVIVAVGQCDGHQIRVCAGESELVGLRSGVDPRLFFNAGQLDDGSSSAWSRGVVATDGQSDLAVDSTRIMSGDVKLDVRYEVHGGTGVFTVQEGTPALVVENLAFDQVWIAKDLAATSRRHKLKRRTTQSTRLSSSRGETTKWIRLSKTERFCFHEWDWHTETHIRLKTCNGQSHTVDVSTLTDSSSDEWSWTTATGETLWPQVLVVNNVRLLRLGKTAVRPRGPGIESMFRLNASLPGVGLSVIGDPKHGRGAELLYASFSSVALHHLEKDGRLTTDLSVGKLQVDEYISGADRPSQRDMIAGPLVSERQSSLSSMLQIRTVRLYQEGLALYESFVVKTRPMFFNLKWSTLSRLLREQSVQHLCRALVYAEWSVDRRPQTSTKSLLHSVEVDPVSVAVNFDMKGCANGSNLLKVLGLHKYAQQLEAGGEQDTGTIQSQRLNLSDIFYTPQQILSDVAADVLGQVATCLTSSSSASVARSESAVAMHQKSGSTRSMRTAGADNFAPEDALVLATEPPDMKINEMVNKVTDTTPGWRHRAQSTRNIRSDSQLFAERWPRVFGLNGTVKDYSVNNVVLCTLLQKSGCSEASELDEDCLSIVAVADPGNPKSRSLMLLTKHTIFFAKPVAHGNRLHNHRSRVRDIGTLEMVFGDEITVRDIQDLTVEISTGTLLLRLSGSKRSFTTYVGERDEPLETEFKLAEFFNHLVGLLENIRAVAAQYRRFGGALLPHRLTTHHSDTTRGRKNGRGNSAPTTVTLTILDASWEDLCTHGRRYSACKTCRRLRLKPNRPSSDDWFCELQVGKRRPRKLSVGKQVTFDVGGGPQCVVALKNASTVGAKCIGTTELRVDSSSVESSPKEQWWSLSPLPGSKETPGAKVKMCMSCSPRIDDTLLDVPRDATLLSNMFDTCTVLRIDIKSIRLPTSADAAHGERLTCALKIVRDGLTVAEKDAFVIVSATEQRCEAHGLEPVLFDLTELSAAGQEYAKMCVHAQLLLYGRSTVVCEEKYPFPGAQIGWAREEDPTTIEQEVNSKVRVARRGDIDVSMKVDAIRTSWTNVDLPSYPQLVDYEITLRTGEHGDAGTDASIFVQLIGDQGHSPRIPLQLREEDLRTGGIVPGGTNMFTVAAPQVGKLQRLRIGHDNTGNPTIGRSQAWFLESAVVERAASSIDSGSDDEPTAEDYAVDGVVFPCGQWFGRPLPVPTSGMTRAEARLKNPGFYGNPLAYTGDVALSRELLAPYMGPICLLETYLVTVSTGCIGTDGLVSLTLFGSDGDSGAHELRHRTKGGQVDAGRRTFEAGAVETFALESFGLGQLRYIKLTLSAVDRTKPGVLPVLFTGPKQGKGVRDAHTVAVEKQLATGWMCEHVTIRNLRTMQCWGLPIHCLLASKENGAGVMDGLSRTIGLGPARQQAVYRVTICTGDVVAAGTEANVSLRMVGQKGQSDLVKLQRTSSSNRQPTKSLDDADQMFQRGETNEFELEVADIGAVFQVELSHDGRGIGSGWFVEEVLVERLGAVVEAAKQAADAPTFGQSAASRSGRSRGRRRTHSYDIATSGSRSTNLQSYDRGSISDTRDETLPDSRIGSLTHPCAHHNLENDPRSSSYDDNRSFNPVSYRSRQTANFALEPVQTRFVAHAWVEDSPLVVEVDLNDPTITVGAGRHSVHWLVTVKTGTMEFAATTSAVSLTLHGTSGEGGTHHLGKTSSLYMPRKGPFARGAESVFSIRTTDLGSLTEVTISHDNSAITTERAAWYLEWVEAIDEGTGVHYHFPCGQWLGGGRTRLESVEDFNARCGGVANDGALFRTLTPLEPGLERYDPTRRVMETAEDTLGTLVFKRLRVLDPVSEGVTRLALSRKRTYMIMSCGTANSTAHSSISTSVHGSHKTLSNARASESWGNDETLRLRVSNTAFGKAELKLVAMGKEKTFGIETTSLVMEGRDKPVPIGEAIIKLTDVFPAAFSDRSRFHSVGGVHHAVYELQSRNSYVESVDAPLRVEILMMFLPNRARSSAEWSRKNAQSQLRNSVPEDYDLNGDLWVDSAEDIDYIEDQVSH